MKLRNLFSLIVMAALTIACDVHEFPKPAVAVPVVLDLEFAVDMPLLTTVDCKTKASGDDSLDVRYVVNAYPIVGGKESMTPCLHEVFSKDEISQLDNSVPIELSSMKYVIRVWADYAAQGSSEDRFYSTDDFSQISLTEERSGSDDYKDAFVGSREIDLSDVVGEPTEAKHLKVEMERPLAKFVFITTDLHEFSQKYATDLSDYHIEIFYTGYMPYMFNVFTNKPIDSRTGVKFPSAITRVGENEATLGYDYVMVNGTQSEVILAISLVDADGNAVSTTAGIKVPLKRSRLTQIKGHFLTEGGSSGVSVNPEFDGDYNIIIN